MTFHPIEDSIIAYFDGQLSDTEGAELLHRVSVSPEIRDLFTQHEMLHQLATRAARNVSVPPRIEEAVFTNIAALQRDERRKVPVAFWSVRRGSMAAVALALLALGLYEVNDWNSVAKFTPAPTVAHAPVPTAQIQSEPIHDIVIAPASSRPPLAESSAPPTEHHARIAATFLPPATSGANVADIPITHEARPVSVESQHIQPPGIISHGISAISMTRPDDQSRFELGLATSSQTVWPGNAIAAGPLRDWTLHAAYALDENDLAGIRIEYGVFGSLMVVPTSTPQFTAYTASMTSGWLTTYGLYYARRQAFDAGRFLIEGSVGAGGYAGGSYVGASIGLRIPIADHFLAGATATVTRRHQNGSTRQDLLSSQSGPVIYDGPDIHTTLLEQIEYGLSYRF